MSSILNLWVQIVPLIAACASGVASSFLMYRLHKFAAAQRKNMLVRQLMHLAAANLLYSIQEILMLSIGIAIWIDPSMFGHSSKSEMCVFSLGVSCLGCFVTLLMECHMAVAFATSIFGNRKTMHTMYTLLVYIWPLGVLLAILDTWLTKVRWDADAGGCYGENKDYVFTVLAIMGFLLCLSCYIISSVVVSRAGQAVQCAVWNRARRYPIVALVTLGPILVYYIIRNLLENNPDVREGAWLVANTLYDSSGFLNFLVYALQSKYVDKKMLEKANGGEREASFRVNFCAEDSVVEAESPPDSRMGSDNTARESLLTEYFEGLNHQPAETTRLSSQSGDGSRRPT